MSLAAAAEEASGSHHYAFGEQPVGHFEVVFDRDPQVQPRVRPDDLELEIVKGAVEDAPLLGEDLSAFGGLRRRVPERMGSEIMRL